MVGMLSLNTYNESFDVIMNFRKVQMIILQRFGITDDILTVYHLLSQHVQVDTE